MTLTGYRRGSREHRVSRQTQLEQVLDCIDPHSLYLSAESIPRRFASIQDGAPLNVNGQKLVMFQMANDLVRLSNEDETTAVPR